MKNTGSENYGGPIVTAGGLVFIAATNYDKKFRAFDKKTGKLLWETTLPFAGNATPATYEVNGRQYIVIATSGAGESTGAAQYATTAARGAVHRVCSSVTTKTQLRRHEGTKKHSYGNADTNRGRHDSSPFPEIRGGNGECDCGLLS